MFISQKMEKASGSALAFNLKRSAPQVPLCGTLLKQSTLSALPYAPCFLGITT